VTVSSDGTRVYVSSRGNGSIHVIDALSGTLLNTVEGIGMDMEMEMGSLSGIAIIQ
jgi:YVTN family beta-propeller protein